MNPKAPKIILFCFKAYLLCRPTPTLNVCASNSQNKKYIIPKIFPHPVENDFNFLLQLRLWFSGMAVIAHARPIPTARDMFWNIGSELEDWKLFPFAFGAENDTPEDPRTCSWRGRVGRCLLPLHPEDPRTFGIWNDSWYLLNNCGALKVHNCRYIILTSSDRAWVRQFLRSYGKVVCVRRVCRDVKLHSCLSKAGASGSSYLPDATKLWYDEGWVDWSSTCTCYMNPSLNFCLLVVLMKAVAAYFTRWWKHVCMKTRSVSPLIKVCHPRWRSDKVLWSWGKAPNNSLSREIDDAMTQRPNLHI